MPEAPTPVLYILARSYATDLPSCNAGKMAAQVSHAANAFVHYMTYERLEEDDAVRCEEQLLKWSTQTNQGFGTVLVLSTDKEKMEAAVMVMRSLGYYTGIVTDPTYPYQVSAEIADLVDLSTHTSIPIVNSEITTLFRSEKTCAWIFVPDKNDPAAKMVLGRFPLHP